MWSGPRNISTAMMRSWGSRADCVVSDEPLYAHYLSTLEQSKRQTHPVFDEVMRSQSTDWREVAKYLTGPVPNNKPVWYQKHMAHHLSDGMDWDWIGQLTNCFLIRDPASMITSFIKVIDNPSPSDLGLPQLVALFDWVRLQTGTIPVVLDSRDVLMNPSVALSAMGDRIGVEFDESMLSWEPGPRSTDGVWGPSWYSSVYQSTGFAPYAPKDEEVPSRLRSVLDECNAMYDVLAQHKVKVSP